MTASLTHAGRAVETRGRWDLRRPNGLEVNPRGQGPRAEAAAARRMPHLKRAMQAA